MTYLLVPSRSGGTSGSEVLQQDCSVLSLKESRCNNKTKLCFCNKYKKASDFFDQIFNLDDDVGKLLPVCGAALAYGSTQETKETIIGVGLVQICSSGEIRANGLT